MSYFPALLRFRMGSPAVREAEGTEVCKNLYAGRTIVCTAFATFNAAIRRVWRAIVLGGLSGHYAAPVRAALPCCGRRTDFWTNFGLILIYCRPILKLLWGAALRRYDAGWAVRRTCKVNKHAPLGTRPVNVHQLLRMGEGATNLCQRRAHL